MKNNIKKVLSNKIFIFSLGALIFGSLGVSASTLFPSNNVTYNNTVSGLNSTNVQGAIDELYNACFPQKVSATGDIILETTTIVSQDDGLYKDEYENGKYTYKGTNPNNYINFNNETWRIISINPNKSIKIIRNSTIGKIEWDSSGSHGDNNWTRPASLNTYLNETYYNKLNTDIKNKILKTEYNIGGFNNNKIDMQTIIEYENWRIWNGKVALPTMSEYIRANSSTNCDTFNKHQDNYTLCKNTNWMVLSDRDWYILTPPNLVEPNHTEIMSSYNVFTVQTSNSYCSSYYANISRGIRPVVTLSSEVQITSGTGTAQDPYQIK